MKKFKNKYRISSARLQNWDYGSEGMYSITICTKNRKHYFGEIKNDKMILTELGNIANAQWLNSPELRPDMNIRLGEFVVMPNHFHGIIMIGKNKYNSKEIVDGGDDLTDCGNVERRRRRDAMHGVSTPDATTTTINKFGPQSKNIGSILRGFKSSVTTYARTNNIDFDWQERFYDHIIRSQGDYLRISNYIKNNPANWKEDKFRFAK